VKRLAPSLLMGVVFAGCATQHPTIAPRRLFDSIKKDDFSSLRAERDRKYVSAQTAVTAAAPAPNKSIPPDAPQKAAAALQDAEAADRALTDAQQSSLNEKFGAVMIDCNRVISGLEATAVSQEKQSFWLSMSGLVAGAVIGPAATAAAAHGNRALISAASGWAGATNLASQTLRTVGLAGDAVATSRNAIVTSLNDAIKNATDTTRSYDQRFADIQRAQAACISYAITVPGAVPDISPPAPAPAPTPAIPAPPAASAPTPK
jgi:hypothetical protein